MSTQSLVSPRVAGAGALGFALSVLAINVVENVTTSRPDPGADPAEVLAWAAGAEPHLWATMILIPISALCLFAFVIGLIGILRRAGSDDTAAIIGGLGVVMIFGTLSAALAIDAAMITNADTLTLELAGVLSDFSIALFIINWASIALTLWALSRAAWAVKLIPRWLERATLIGAAMLALGSTQGVFAIRGILAPLLVGLLGFGIWLLFLIVVGVRAMRFEARASAHSSTAAGPKQVQPLG